MYRPSYLYFHSLIEEERMKEALKKPEVQAILQDPDIQQLIHLLKDNPRKAQQ